MKYIRLKPFKELQAAEVGSDSDGDKIEIIETTKTGSKRSNKDSLVDVEQNDSSSSKKIRMEESGINSGEAVHVRDTNNKLSSVQVLGHELFYKQHAATVLFKTSSIMELLESKMPYQQSSQLVSVVDKSKASKDSNKKSFISWSGLKQVLNGGLLDLSIREALLKNGNNESNNDHDVIMLNEQKVRFKVKNGLVYLEVLSAFSALGRLHEALDGNWSFVDTVLANANISIKSAFKKKATGDIAMPGTVSRNYITFQAFKLICSDGKLKDTVSKLIEIIDNIKQEEGKICTEIQHTVNMILRMSCIVPSETSNGDDTDCSGSFQLEQKYCAQSLCGRGYHYVSRCCAKSHNLVIADQDVGYVRKSGEIFLEKCSAFALIGRPNVIRCSDYKKVDSLLLKQSKKTSVDEFFLFEKEGFVRNLRTHISLNGYILLVEAGFDATGNKNLLSALMEVRNSYQVLRRESCEEFETIDLSSSEVDTETDDVKEKVKESSSGLDSEESSPPLQRKRMKSFNDYDSDDDSNMETVTVKHGKDFVEILGAEIPMHVFNEKIYVEKAALMKVSEPDLQWGIRNIDKLLVNEGVFESALTYQGRQKVFLSVEALQKLLEQDEMKGIGDEESLRQEIAEILSNFNNEKTQILNLEHFEDLKFKLVGGVAYLETQKLLRLAGFSTAYFKNPPAKANLFLCRILSERGVNTQNCFFKHGKSKYAFMSIAATSVLLRSDIGQLKDNDKSARLIEDIIEALENKSVLRKNSDKQEMSIKILEEFPPIKYKILDGKLFLHRKSTFECLELETSVLSNRKGYLGINNILKQNGLDVDQCYLASRQQKYSYISCIAIIHLLQSQDPMVVCLTNKDRFLAGLLSVLQKSATATLALDNEDDVGSLDLDKDIIIEVRCKEGIVYINRSSAFKFSGLGEQEVCSDASSVMEERGLDSSTAFLSLGDDPCGWVSLHCLYLFLSVAIRELNITKVAWRDILSAVSLYEPRIKTKLKIEAFKTMLISKLESYFVDHSSVLVEKNILEKQEIETFTFENMTSKDWTLPIINRNLKTIRFSSDQMVPGSDSGPNSPQPPSTLHSPSVSCFPSPTGSMSDLNWSISAPEVCPLSKERFLAIRKDIMEQVDDVSEDSDMFIGDWRVDVMEEDYLKLCVRSGYGASRKNSFLHPDIAAILRYSLVLTPTSISLTINEKSIENSVITKILERTEIEGTLSFLVQLISLRPCFGSFSPELVETVSQSLSRSDIPEDLKNVYIDSNFIGSSSCGRTYAGTVRHRQCRTLAVDRVSDICAECRQLSGLTINRSVLSQKSQVLDPGSVTESDKGQKSVWQLATTCTDSCTFVCPQVQSFNTSLPHAFDGRAQASTIVSHKVEIANNLNVKVHLSDRGVSKSFTEFQKSRQLGPLLDVVASLRLCVGYPNTPLVTQARYILDNLDRTNPDVRKLFRHLVIDDKFDFTMIADGDKFTGSIRSVSCNILAETCSDICSQCRALQEPMEFLSSS